MDSAGTPLIFFAVLNMGLGHASRSLPVMREILSRRWGLLVGSSGRSLAFLRKELPAARFIELPDYNLHYSAKGASPLQLIAQTPHLLKLIGEEHELTRKIISREPVRLIISDHRYGCHSGEIPSLFIAHQIRFIAPTFLKPFEFVGALFNRHYHKAYQKVIIPDLRDGSKGLLSGRLSQIKKGDQHYVFAGILSSLHGEKVAAETIDVLVSISGPEPQRSIFEDIILKQIEGVPGKKVVPLGLPDQEFRKKTADNLEIYSHLDREHLGELFLRSRLIVTRSGYSTLMELAELGKKALLVPTPGQTEQLFLARRFAQKGWFYMVEQDKMQLPHDIEMAQRFPGFTAKYFTGKTLRAIFRIIEEVLDLPSSEIQRAL